MLWFFFLLFRFSNPMNATRANQHFQLFDTIPWMVVYICEATVILTENLITAYIFWNIRRRLRRASYLLINLAVADFTVGIALIFWLWDGIAAMKGRHLSYSVGEKIVIFDVTVVVASLLSLALISLERMCAILWPFRHRLSRKWYYVTSVGSVWTLAILNGVANINFNEQFSLFTVISSITSVVVVSVAYFAIWIKTRRHNLPGKTSRSQEHDRRLAKTLCIVTGLSILFCLPSGVTLALNNYTQNIHSFGFQITIVALYANSFLNPIVYCFKMPEFKQALGKLFCRYFGNRLNFQEKSLGVTNGVFLTSIEAVEAL